VWNLLFLMVVFKVLHWFILFIHDLYNIFFRLNVICLGLAYLLLTFGYHIKQIQSVVGYIHTDIITKFKILAINYNFVYGNRS
jgi:hypothetical protein